MPGISAVLGSLHHMTDRKKYTFFPKLSQLELNILHKMAENELQRWNDIISADDQDPLVAQHYEYDSIHLSNVLCKLEEYISNKEVVQEVPFSARQTRIIIESINNAFDLCKEGKSNLEEFHTIDNMRTRFRQEAIEKYGEQILDPMH